MIKTKKKPSTISSDFSVFDFFIRRTILLLFILSLSAISFSQFTDSGINLGTGGYNNCIWGDYDNDGDLDILLAGYNSKVFQNNGDKTFTEISVPFSVNGYTATWIDYDNDNDLDIFLGNKLYKNRGGNTFSEVLIEDMNDYNMGVTNFSSVDVMDYDNDGDQDLLIGYEGKILIFNNRDGKFLLVDQSLAGGENIGNLYINNIWIDAANRGYYDILCSKLYKNNSQNLYSIDPGFNINDTGYRVSAGDYNSDGYLDAIFIGWGSQPAIMMKNLNGVFANAGLSCLSNVTGGSLARFGDFNNDGKLDIITGSGTLFANNGNEDFTKTFLNWGNVFDINWGDYDNDGVLDLIFCSNSPAKIFNNGLTNSNQAPSVPSNLINTINGNNVTFSWDRSTDDGTPGEALTYNICLINTSINDTIKPPGANLATGYLLEPKIGNTQSNNFWKIKGLRPGNYEWTVQAIDHSFKGSSFAAFKTFQITSSCTISPSANQVLDPNQNGSLLTITETVAVSSRQWTYSVFPGGPYNYKVTGATNTTYIPKFIDDGRYFIICKSVVGADTLFSNEVMVEVLPFTETSIPGIPNFYTRGSMKPGDSDNDGDLDLLVTGDNGTNLYVNTNNIYSPVSITSGLVYGDAAWFDYNNDNKLDFIITGASSVNYTRIFINQGGNTFTELPHDIIGLAYGSVDAGDFDHDGDADILICGKTGEPVTKIYRNDNGKFTDINAGLNQVCDGVARWGDYNNDGNLDIFISGTDFSGNPFTALYRNDGVGGFVQISYKFKPNQYSFAEFGDYNNDGNIDILLAGSSPSGNVQTIIYKNQGNDQFKEIILYNDRAFNYVKWLDYNNDGLLDVLLVGNEWYSLSYAEKSRKYHILKNYGDDVFKEIVYRKPWVNDSKLIALADFDNNGSVDILQSATDLNTGNRFVSAYYNKSYIVKPLPPPPTVLKSARRGKDIILSWNKPEDPAFNGISYDLMVGTAPDFSNIVSPLSNINTGYRMVAQPGFITDTSYKVTITTKDTYYWKVQAINNSFKGSAFSATGSFDVGEYFNEIATPFIPLRYDVTYDWGDYDNDGDQDLLLGGKYWLSPNWLSFGYIYENKGNGTFSSTPTDLGSRGANLKWIDIDNDNDLDIAGMMGNWGETFKIFENKGNGTFIERNNISSYSADFSYGDFNNDGLTDFLIGNNWFLINKGNFTFENYSFPVPVSFEKSAKGFHDLDNDLDQDLVAFDQGVFVIYENRGNSFVKVPLNLPTFYPENTDFDIGDLDNDGDLDIVISGYTTVGIKQTFILRNDGKMNFTEVGSLLRGTTNGSVSLGDYDNDNDLDILLSGNSFSVITKVYENKGNFSFQEMDYTLAGQWQGKTGWSDFDEDGDLDVIIAGTAEGYGGQSKLFRNDLNIPAPPVFSPSLLNSESVGYGIKLSWKDILNSGISYNVRVGSVSGKYDIVSPMADVVTGKRKVTGIGNADMNLSYLLDSLPVGTYYWSVQAINGAFKGGPWSAEESFTISVVNAAFSSDIVCNGDSTYFTDNTITSGESLSDWRWDFGDGNKSRLKNPAHLYQNAGSYSVKLVVSTANYSDSITNIVVVKPVPVTGFTVDLVCQGTPTTLTNTTDPNSLTISAWLWNFGDGGTSTLRNPGVHGFLNPGDYNVTLWSFADNGCSASTQKTATVAAYPSASITTSGRLVFCKGDSVVLSVPKDKNYTYKWLLNETSITGGDSSYFNAKLSGIYSVKVINNTGNCTTTSLPVAVTAQNAPVAPLISAGGALEFCDGDSAVLSVVHATGNEYQWKLNGGAVGSGSNKFIARSSGNYTLTVFNSTGCFVTSTNSINVSVISRPTLPTINISGPTTFCQGGSVQMSVANDPSLTYHWENNGSAITGAVSNNYTAQTSGVYLLKISNSGGCYTNTENVNVSVLTAPSAPSISASGSTTFCQGDSVVLSVTDTPGYTYQWKLNGGAVGSDSSGFVAKNSGTYNLVVFNNTGCFVNSSNSIDITVNSLPAVSTISMNGPIQFCQGKSVTLSVVPIAGNSYIWYNRSGPITGAVSNSFSATLSGDYLLEISNSSGCRVKTDPVSVIVQEMPLKPAIDTGNYSKGKCPGESPIKISVKDAVARYNYQWYKNGAQISTSTSLQGFLEQGYYYVEASISGCKKASDSLNVYFKDAPPKPMIYAKGPTVWYLTSSITTASKYKWYYNGKYIAGADGYIYVASQNLGKYNLSISNDNVCFTISDTITIPIGATNIEENDPFAGLRIYPNPTTGWFTIEMNNNIFGELVIDIFTQNGSKALNIKFEKTTEHFSSQIDLSGQPSGMYLINLAIDKFKSTRKILVE